MKYVRAILGIAIMVSIFALSMPFWIVVSIICAATNKFDLYEVNYESYCLVMTKLYTFAFQETPFKE